MAIFQDARFKKKCGKGRDLVQSIQMRLAIHSESLLETQDMPLGKKVNY